MKTYKIELTEEELDFLANRLAQKAESDYNQLQTWLAEAEAENKEGVYGADEYLEDVNNHLKTDTHLYDSILIKLGKARITQ